MKAASILLADPRPCILSLGGDAYEPVGWARKRVAARMNWISALGVNPAAQGVAVILSFLGGIVMLAGGVRWLVRFGKRIKNERIDVVIRASIARSKTDVWVATNDQHFYMSLVMRHMGYILSYIPLLILSLTTVVIPVAMDKNKAALPYKVITGSSIGVMGCASVFIFLHALALVHLSTRVGVIRRRNLVAEWKAQGHTENSIAETSIEEFPS